MGFGGGGGGGGGGVVFGTLAGRPAAAAASGKTYVATDRVSVAFSDGSTWWDITATEAPTFSVKGGIGGLILSQNALDVSGSGSAAIQVGWTAGTAPVNLKGVIQNITAANEVATATAGAGAAPPATVQGYLKFTDSGGTVRKLPYYAN